MKSTLLLCSSVVAASLLAGCAQPGPPAEAPRPALAAHSPASALQAIRRADEGLDSAVQVQPLRDADIESFLARAHGAERAGHIDQAVSEADQALALAPDAPDILQYRAELEVARGQWRQAEQFAIRSFTLGPKVGGLCARNWQTVVEARLALDDAATMEQAKKRLAECRVKPRLRM
jgi:hypothetical protein